MSVPASAIRPAISIARALRIAVPIVALLALVPLVLPPYSAILLAYGLVMAIGALAVIAGYEDKGDELARTMGLTTFAIANLMFSFTARDALRSIFSLDTFSDRTFLLTTGLSVASIIFVTELRPFQRVFHTVEQLADIPLGHQQPVGKLLLGQPFAGADLGEDVELRQAQIVRAHLRDEPVLDTMEDAGKAEPERGGRL